MAKSSKDYENYKIIYRKFLNRLLYKNILIIIKNKFTYNRNCMLIVYKFHIQKLIF